MKRRTANTAAALFTGVAIVSCLGVVASSAKVSVLDLVDNGLSCDFSIRSASRQLNPEAVKAVESVEGIKSVNPVNMIVGVKYGNETIQGMTVTVKDTFFTDVLNPQIVDGDPVRSFSEDKIVIGEKLSKDHGWKVGDEIEAQGTSLKYFLKPFSSMHTSDPDVKSQVILLSIVSALLILISLLNYILIVISSMVKRSKEVGVRKCYGAEGKHIYGMLTKEALLHIVLSLVLAAAIIFAGRSIVENLLGVPFQTLLVPQSIMAIAAVILLVLVISIVVPAELYQRVPVYAALKNYTENSRNWKLGLLGVQVLINVFLVVMMLIIGRQYQKVSNADTGYDYKNLYYFDMFDGDRQALTRAAQTLRSLPEVSAVAAAYNLPFEGSNGDNVYLPNDDRELFNIADQYECSPDFYDLMGIQLLEGRAPRDSSEIVVDAKFVTKMAEFTDWSDGAVGKQVFITGHDRSSDTERRYFTISGVYKSYIIGNLTGVDPRPSALFYGEIGSMSSWMPHTFFKVRPEALPKIRQALEQALEGREINILSYEEQMRAAYADSKKMRNTMAIGAVFSLLIALLGLIGFIRDESLRRSKEMAVRKINGATTRDILGVFAVDILKLSGVMAVIACIAAFFVARKWLEQFAEKVSLSPLYFIGGALLVLLIVLGVVVLNCLKIARANPVESLKNE